MKLLLVLVLLLSIQTQQREAVDCVVVGIKDGSVAVVCDHKQPADCSPLHNEKACMWSGMVITADSWPAIWPKAEKGLLVRAVLVDDILQPVPVCLGRASRILDRPSYERPPVNATRDECSTPASKFIEELLRKD